MNVLFIGNSFPPKILSLFFRDTKGKNNLSCHNFEQSFINGLSQQDNINVKVILVPWVGTFPMSYRKLFVQRESFNKDGISIESIGYCNALVLNGITRRQQLYRQLLKTIDKFPEGDIHIIVNTFKFPMLKAIQMVAEKTKRHLTQTVIMMDMPGFEIIKKQYGPLKKRWMQYNLRKTMTLLFQSDSIVALTKHFINFFDKPMKFMVMEGLVDVGEMDKESHITLSTKKVVLYTGSIMRIYGIMNLIDAFEMANIPDSELWICGSGDMANEIEKRSLLNPNIKYLGLLNSKETWRKQREATVLVNPRNSEGEFTKYSFPSKTLEYLLAGRPVIANKLAGIPNEYVDYCIFPKDESVEELAKSIKYVLSLTEEKRTEIGKRGKQFVIENKNSKRQVGRVIELIKTL